MKSLKQIVSLMLVLLLTLSSVAFAASAEEFTPSEEAVLYFEVPENWNNATTIFCHIWEYGSTEPFASWQSKKEKCTDEGEGVFSYNIDSKLKVTLEDGVMYCVIFSANTGAQTYDLFFGTDCFGDTAYCDGTMYENPQDSNKQAQAAFWKHQDPLTYGPIFQITSIGNTVGTTMPPNRTTSDIFSDFLIFNLENARTYSGKTDQAIVESLAGKLGLSDAEVSDVILATGVYVDWTPGNSSSGDEIPTTPDETTPDETTPDETTPSDPDDEDTVVTLYCGDADLDGEFTIKDATLIQKAVAGLVSIEYPASICADVDLDENLTIKDATEIQKYVAGLLTITNIGMDFEITV